MSETDADGVIEAGSPNDVGAGSWRRGGALTALVLVAAFGFLAQPSVRAALLGLAVRHGNTSLQDRALKELEKLGPAAVPVLMDLVEQELGASGGSPLSMSITTEFWQGGPRQVVLNRLCALNPEAVILAARALGAGAPLEVVLPALLSTESFDFAEAVKDAPPSVLEELELELAIALIRRLGQRPKEDRFIVEALTRMPLPHHPLPQRWDDSTRKIAWTYKAGATLSWRELVAGARARLGDRLVISRGLVERPPTSNSAMPFHSRQTLDAVLAGSVTSFYAHGSLRFEPGDPLIIYLSRDPGFPVILHLEDGRLELMTRDEAVARWQVWARERQAALASSK